MRLRIGIDNVSAGEATQPGAPGGMRMYLVSLLTRFAHLRKDYEFIVFSGTDFEPLPGLPPNVRFVQLPLVPKSRALRTLYQQTLFPLWLSFYRLDVFFEIATVCPWLLPVPTVLTVQFLQVFDAAAAKYEAGFRTAYLKAAIPLSVRKARKVIIFTESSRGDLMRRTGVNADKVTVIPHGLSPEVLNGCGSGQALDAGIPAGKDYLVFVSATYWYKNHIQLIRGYARFAGRHAERPLLVLAGAEVHVPYATLKAEAEKRGVADSVLILGWVAEVAPLYANALASVFPSVSETFGFPVLEAMACGCPVITSRSGSMGELGGKAAVLIDPESEEEIADAIERVVSDPQLRARMSGLGLAWARQFTWDATAAKTLELIELASGKAIADPVYQS